jgi:O-antigen/teichoic acid export membrane protein
VLIGPSVKKSALQARIVSGSLVLLSGSTLATAINLAYNVAVAHFLGPKGFGNATALYTLLTLISAVTLSFQIVTAKIVAQQGDEASRDAAYRDLQRAAWASGLFVAFLLIAFQRQITNYLNLPGTTLVIILAIGAAFYVPLGSRRGYIQGAYGFRKLATNLVFEGAARLVGSLLMVALGFGVTGVIMANAAAIAVAYFAIAPKLNLTGSNPLSFENAFREVLHAGVFFAGQVLINNCDIVLVKHFFASGDAGLYAAIAMVGRVTFACSSAIVNSMFPVIAGSKHEERKNLSLIGTALLLVLGVGTILALGLRLTPSWVWTTLFGSSFQIPGPHGFPYLLALYAITTLIYCLSVVVMTYEMSYKIANTNLFQLLFSGVLIAGICKYHASLQQVIMVQLVLLVAFLILIAVPFLLGTLGSAEFLGKDEARKVRLVRRIGEDDVIAEFLKSEFQNAAYSEYHSTLRGIVFNPDLEDKAECAARRSLLDFRHRALWKELPLGTQWYEVEIGASDLDQIRVFPRAQWARIARGNFAITKVAERIRSRQQTMKDPFVGKISDIRQDLSADNLNAGSVILIGLTESDSLTILDGNHRFVAGVLEGKVERLRFVCGLSTNMTQCCWYKTNLFNLARYGRHLLRHFFQIQNAELLNFCDTSGTLHDKASPPPVL